MNRREFIFGATSIALGATAFSEILLAKGNARGTIELLIEDAESLKGLSGKKLRSALSEQLVIRSKFRGRIKGRLVMFRMVKGEIKDQFVSDMFRIKKGEAMVPGNMYIPGEMYIPGDMYVPGDMFIPGDMFVPGEMFVPGDMFKNARESAMETLKDGSGFFFIVMAESKEIMNKGGALATE